MLIQFFFFFQILKAGYPVSGQAEIALSGFQSRRIIGPA